MRLYRFDNVEIVDRPESFSEAALDAIARHGFSPSMVRGFYDSASDTVYFNAARLSPSEVPGVVFHELVAHKGLREVLAPEAFHSMLDSVSSRHGGEARFREIAERYHLDLETENGRREAAEEYIAHLAEERNEALKPSWWREFLAQVKQLLRRLPYLDRVRWSDREIEALLRRSARALRRRSRAGSNRDAGMFFAVNENGETLFHITGRDNAMTAQEIIDDPTISPDDFVLTSEGSEIWGEITPEMVEKAGKKYKLKALPIKLKKGVHFFTHSGFGLVHLYTEHGKELEGKHYDLSALLTRIFGKPYQVYASLDSGTVRLEMVTRNRPREIGVLELQEENGFYSVITAFTRELDHYKLRGKEVWRYTGSTPNKISQEGSSVISASKQRTGPLYPLSAENTADTASTSRTKPVSNINDSQEKSSLSDDSSHFSIAEDSAAFQRWFADSKVVDADGKPLVVYHGSSADFSVFSYKFNNRNGQAEGRGFYFTDNRSYAEGYQSDGGKLFEVYLSLQNPLNPKELTITKQELRKIINAIDPDGDGISNYAEDSRGYPGAAWRSRALDSAVNAIYDSSENNADIIGELYSSFGGGTVLEEVRRISGYDGFMTGNENGDTVYVVFSPTQIKSATENVGTFDPENPDIRFSESGQAEELANLMAKRVAPIIRDASGRDSDVREEVRTLLSQEGFDLSDAELEEIIKRAQQQVRRFRSLLRLTEENDYIRATDPWIATLQDVYSTNFKISTAGKYATEDFSGTWIGKDGGVAPDEAARTLSAAFGQEITDDDVVDHFRYLKRRDLLAKRREENKAMEEALREEERLHDMELAEQILAGEFPFDDEFIGANPRVAKMVRDMVSPAKPGEPRADWATVRAALGQENPQEFAKGYFEGREAGRQEYRERLREARKNTTDIRTLQEVATREVRRVLPEELQGAFLKRIADLGKFRPFMRTENCTSPPTPGPDRAA